MYKNSYTNFFIQKGMIFMFNITVTACTTLAKTAALLGTGLSAYLCADKEDFDLGEEVKNTAIGTAVVVGIAALATGAIYLIKKCTSSDPKPGLTDKEAKSFAQVKTDSQVKSVEALVDGKEKTL